MDILIDEKSKIINELAEVMKQIKRLENRVEELFEAVLEHDPYSQ